MVICRYGWWDVDAGVDVDAVVNVDVDVGC